MNNNTHLHHIYIYIDINTTIYSKDPLTTRGYLQQNIQVEIYIYKSTKYTQLSTLKDPLTTREYPQQNVQVKIYTNQDLNERISI